MKPSVSVIMPTYNGMKYIKQAIDSAINQTLPVFEIIIVDDGSTDETEDIVSSYGDQVRYIRQNNKGTAGAYNAGIKAASGKYIAFLEHDDIWLPEKNSTHVQFLENNQDYDMVYSPVILLEEGIVSKGDATLFQDGQGEYSFNDFFVRNRILNCSSVMIKKSVFQKVSSFREDLKLAFDYDLWLRVAYHFKIMCLSEPLAKYRIHANNLSGDAYELMAAEGSLNTILFWSSDTIANELVGSNNMKERIVKLYKRVAWDYALLDQRQEELSHLWAAVKVQPLRFDLWQYFLWRSIDRQTRSRISWYTNKLFAQKTN